MGCGDFELDNLEMKQYSKRAEEFKNNQIFLRFQMKAFLFRSSINFYTTASLLNSIVGFFNNL